MPGLWRWSVAPGHAHLMPVRSNRRRYCNQRNRPHSETSCRVYGDGALRQVMRTLCLSVRIVDDIETNVTDCTAGQVIGFTEIERCVRSCVPYAVSRADRSRNALAAGHDAGSALSQVKRWLVGHSHSQMSKPCVAHPARTAISCLVVALPIKTARAGCTFNRPAL